MVEKIEDLNLPMSIVSRIIKDALPEGASCSKESRNALTRWACIFVWDFLGIFKEFRKSFRYLKILMIFFIVIPELPVFSFCIWPQVTELITIKQTWKLTKISQLPACTEVAQKQNHKTLNANHVLTALKNTEFESFAVKLTDQLEEFRKTAASQKKSKKKDSVGGEEAEAEGDAEEEP